MKQNTHTENQINKRKSIRLAIALLLLVQLLSFPIASVNAATDGDDDENSMGNISAKGCFTCDFTITADFPLGQVAPVIERDRMYMAERRGMQRKQIPMRFANEAHDLFSGG